MTETYSKDTHKKSSGAKINMNLMDTDTGSVAATRTTRSKADGETDFNSFTLSGLTLGSVEAKEKPKTAAPKTKSATKETKPGKTVEEKKTERKNEIAQLMRIVRLSEHVDVCFMLDCTGSMGPWINAVKSNIFNLQQRLKTSYPQLKLRFGFVRYTDYDEGSRRFSVLNFTESTTEFKDFLNSISASGGGDAPEDVLGGLDCVLNQLSWQEGTKVLIHIADAPAHGKRFYDGPYDSYPLGYAPGYPAHSIEELMKKAVQLQLNYWFGYINQAMTNKMIAEFSKVMASLSSNQLTIQQFDAKDTGTIIESSYIAVTHSMSTTRANAEEGASGKSKWSLRTYKITKDVPDWTKISSETVQCTRMVLPATLEDIKSGEFDRKDITLKIKVAAEPFAEGAIRLAYYCYNESHSEVVVVKQSKRIGGRSNSLKHYYEEMQTQAAAAKLAMLFNEEIKPKLPVKFSVAKVLHFKNETKPRYMAMEKVISGEYKKYNNNAGAVLGDSDIMQAFSHYTYHRSGGYLMVVDLQGVVNDKGYYLTDPAIHCRNLLYFGKTNLGVPGMKKFFQTHKCNSICSGFKVEPLKEDTRA